MKNCVDNTKKTALDYALAGKHHQIIDFEKKLTTTLYAKKSGNGDNAGTSSLKVSVDDFEYIMNLGRGAFGEVVLVKKRDSQQDDDKGKYFAMKIMKKRKYSGLLNFVLTEKEVSRKVRHPSIVRLFYAFQTFDKLYLLTEFCPGGDLRALLSSKGAPKKGLNESEAKLYLAEVLIAIDELHKNGILHRDIKPENIMLDG